MVDAQLQITVIEATTKEVQKHFPSWSNSTVSRKIQQVRDALNKPKPKVISIDEVLSYYL